MRTLERKQGGKCSLCNGNGRLVITCDDWGYGKVYATVRVYIYGTLRDQWEDVELINDELWDTHFIDWPTGVVTRIGTPAAPQIWQNARP